MRRSILVAVFLLAAAAAQAQIITADRVRASANLTVSPVGDIVFAPGGGDVYPSPNYGVNLGLLNAKFLTLHAAELWAETLVAQSTMATIGGRVLVGPTTQLTADLTDSATSIVVKHNSLANGDRVYLEADGKVEFLAVTSAASGTGPYTYSVTRNLDGSGANAWYAGDAVFDTGQTGNGFIDLYSVRGVKAASEYGPTIVGNVRNSATYNDWSPRWAVGNLNGLYGKSTTVYGFAAGDVAKAHVLLNDTDGLVMKYGSTPYLTIDTLGNATFAGRVTVGGSSNQLQNTEFRTGLAEGAGNGDPWGVVGVGPNAATWSIGRALAGYTVTNGGTGYIRNTANPIAANDYAYAEGPDIPVTGSSWYEWSAYLVTINCIAKMELVFWTAGGTPTTVTGDEVINAKGSATALTDYVRSALITQAPADAVKVTLRFRYLYGGASPGSAPWIFFTRLFFGEAHAGQTQASPWAPGGVTEITGDAIRTGTVTADKISATSLSAISANLGTITAGSISGVTMTAGGTVTLDGNGISVASGGMTGANTYKFSTGEYLYAAVGGGTIGLHGNAIAFAGASGNILTNGRSIYNDGTSIDLVGRVLGESGESWTIHGGTYYSGTAAGVDCSGATSVDVTKGIVTGCSAPVSAPSAATVTSAASAAQIADLEARVADLEATVRSLSAQLGAQQRSGFDRERVGLGTAAVLVDADEVLPGRRWPRDVGMAGSGHSAEVVVPQARHDRHGERRGADRQIENGRRGPRKASREAVGAGIHYGPSVLADRNADRHEIADRAISRQDGLHRKGQREYRSPGIERVGGGGQHGGDRRGRDWRVTAGSQ